MEIRTSLVRVIVLNALFLAMVARGSQARGDEGYLAVGGNNGMVEFLRFPDFTKAFAIDVRPMTFPTLRYLPQSRRLYVYDPWTTSLNTVLDVGACSGGLLRPLGVLNPNFIAATGDESKVLIGSNPGAHLRPEQNTVYVVDPASDTISSILPESTSTGSGGFATGSFFDPDRNELYVSWDIHASRVFDSNLNLLRQCVGWSLSAVAGGKIYVPRQSQAEVWDAVTCQYLRSIPLPGPPGHAVRTRAGDKVYILTHNTPDDTNPNPLDMNAVAVIDTASDQVLTFPLNRLLISGSLALSADETRAYVGMDVVGTGGSLGVLDLQSGALQEYPLDMRPTNSIALVDRLGFQCGDGVVEAACGEQCDPPGSIIGGTVCDANCTTGCGNGIASGTELCDDGNTNNNDACKNDCTPNVCGDGFVSRAVEQCDHGALNGTAGDACSASCALPPRTASADLVAGGTLTTDAEGDGATTSALVETWVTSPLAGSVSIEEGGPDPTSPSGYAFLGYSVHVTVPSSTPDNPIQLAFEIHSSLLPEGSDQTAVEMAKNGALIPECDGGTSAASPDPCIASRALLANGNLRVSVRSSTASYWGGVAPYHDARIMPRRGVALTIPAKTLSVTRKLSIRVRNADPVQNAKKRTTPIQLTATSVDCPLGLIADVPDFNVRQPFAQDTVTLAPRRNATAKLRLMASRFAFPKDGSPRHCTIRLTGAALVADNVDPTPADNTLTVPITVTTR
jgi:cysteine-rich repeat protein